MLCTSQRDIQNSVLWGEITVALYLLIFEKCDVVIPSSKLNRSSSERNELLKEISVM